MESGRVSATHVLVEKKIRNPGAVGRITCKFTITSKPKRILHVKTQEIWGVGTARIFTRKQGVSGGWSSAANNIHNQNEAQAHFIRYTQRFFRGWRSDNKIYSRNEARRIF